MSLYVCLIIAYLVGSVPFAIVVSRFMKMDDPRSYGSKNAGATNIMRSGNKKAAIYTLLCDFLKGLFVVLLARHYLAPISGGEALVAICGILVVLGHVYPVFFKFKGGKGVATAIGAIFGFNLWVAILLVTTWGIVFKLSRVSSLSALVATVLAPVYAYILMGNSSYFAGILIISFFILYKHKTNIIRLVKGQEHRFDNSSTSSIDKNDPNKLIK